MKWHAYLSSRSFKGWFWSTTSVIVILTPIVFQRGIERIWFSDLAVGPDTVSMETVRLVDSKTGIELPADHTEAAKWQRRGYRLIRQTTMGENDVVSPESASDSIADSTEAPESADAVAAAPVHAPDALPVTLNQETSTPVGTIRIREKQTWVRGAPVLALPYLGSILLRHGEDNAEELNRQAVCICPR